MIFPIVAIKPIMLLVAHHLIRNTDVKVNLDLLLYEKYKFGVHIFNSKIKKIQINNKEYTNLIDLFTNIKTKVTNKKLKNSYDLEEQKEIKQIKYKIDYPNKETKEKKNDSLS